jgi:hypothetical protein
MLAVASSLLFIFYPSPCARPSTQVPTPLLPTHGCTAARLHGCTDAPITPLLNQRFLREAHPGQTLLIYL